MKAFIKKLWLDSTTNTHSGKYSSKRLMGWQCMELALILCIFFPDRLELIITLLTAAFASVGMTMTGHFLRKKDAAPPEPITDKPL